MDSMPSSRQHDRARQQSAAGAAAQQLRDEYTANFEDDGGETFVLDKFQLESGRLMHRVPIRFKTWGKLNGTRDNVLVVCHALTGNGTYVPATKSHVALSWRLCWRACSLHGRPPAL